MISVFEHNLRANAFSVCREAKPVLTFSDHALTEAAAFLDHLDLVAVGIGDEEEARQRRAIMPEVAQRSWRKLVALEAGMFGVDVIDDDGEMAISVTEHIRLVAVEVDRELDLERRGGVSQVNQREVRKFQMVGDFEPKCAGVEVERSLSSRTRIIE